jgi:hypothetical protein
MTGLETHIFQQCRFGEGIFGYRVSVVNTLPPPEKVQQLVRVCSQDSVGHPTAAGVTSERFGGTSGPGRARVRPGEPEELRPYSCNQHSVFQPPA